MSRLLATSLFFVLAGTAAADSLETAKPTQDSLTLFDHPDDQRFWFSGQVNVIFQYHPDFSAKYAGPNSLGSKSESATSLVLSLYTGVRLHRTNEILFDAELAAGGGLSTALGLAGFTNLDVVRNPTLGSDPYVARVMFHQVIPLSSTWTKNARTFLSTLPELPLHRLELRFGKLSTVDFFDTNGAASDSHMQFMNWTVDNNGAYDYAADTRGYTWGALVEYIGPRLEVRFGEMLMPTVANGIEFDTDLEHAHAENIELGVRYLTRPRWNGTLRLLTFINHARMGLYREAISAFVAMPNCPMAPTMVCPPDIEAHRQAGRIKYGLGLNVEQRIHDVVRAFLRIGWNEGENESFAYTEVDDTFEVGGDIRGTPWHRDNDKVGLAFVSNGISESHRRYLTLGGKGFLLGDGALTYGRETILETYYNLQLARGIFAAADIQVIVHPGYNQDRGPLAVFAARAHMEF